MLSAQGGADGNARRIERRTVLLPIQVDLKRLLEKVIIELSLEVGFGQMLRERRQHDQMLRETHFKEGGNHYFHSGYFLL